MSILSVAGMKSCATISISGFNHYDYDLNKEEITDDARKNYLDQITNFYNDVLYPTDQKLGETGSIPLSFLLHNLDIDNDDEEHYREPVRMDDKFITCTLNQYQVSFKDGYWPNLLESFGFKEFEKTKNNIGDVCTIYYRNRAKVD